MSSQRLETSPHSSNHLTWNANICDEPASLQAAFDHCNKTLANLTAQARIRWALDHLPGQHVLTSSFGAQAAVSLHLVTSQCPDIPVVLIDTGYLFPETYHFIDQLTERLSLNLKVYRPQISPAWQEARHGKRWEGGANGIVDYNEENKVAPMRLALEELGVGTWFAGLRRQQSASRSSVAYLESSGQRWKVHAIADWTDRDVHRYLKQHELPYHPLWDQGYVSIGDVHTTRSVHEVSDVAATRFFGIRRECGLHEMDLSTA